MNQKKKLAQNQDKTKMCKFNNSLQFLRKKGKQRPILNSNLNSISNLMFLFQTFPEFNTFSNSVILLYLRKFVNSLVIYPQKNKIAGKILSRFFQEFKKFFTSLKASLEVALVLFLSRFREIQSLHQGNKILDRHKIKMLPLRKSFPIVWDKNYLQNVILNI